MKVSVNVALGSGQFGMSIMQAVFMFYYVKVFLNIFQLDQLWFDLAQFLFMLWNSVNDPLFGYLQDLSNSWLKNRRKVILYLSPFLVVSFYILWFPWTTVGVQSYVCGIHLLIALFLYDAFYSFINVAWSALFAESTYEGCSRITAIKYSQAAVLLSSIILPVSEKISKGLTDFSAFQCMCVVVGLIAMLCFYITGCLEDKAVQHDRYSLLPQTKEALQSFSAVVRTTKQIFSKRDFLVVVATHFIHSCRSVSHLNFATIATDLLIPNEVIAKGSWQMSLFYASCAVLPQVLLITSGDFFVRQGVYRIVLGSFVLSVILSVFFWLTAFKNPYMLITFLFIDSVAVHSIAPLFQVLLAEFIEDDVKRFSRMKPISSTIFSLDALIVKPAQSVAPVFIVHILNTCNYQAYQRLGEKPKELVSCMFSVLCFIPLILGFLQFIIFRNWSLQIKHNKIESLRDHDV